MTILHAPHTECKRHPGAEAYRNSMVELIKAALHRAKCDGRHAHAEMFAETLRRHHVATRP